MLIWREKTRRWWFLEIQKWRWVIAVLCGAVVMAPVHAQSMHSTTALTNGASASSQYASSTLWLSRDVDGFGTQYLSAVRMGPNWGITAAHGFEFGGNFRVGNGSNYLTDPGITANVTSFVTHPQAVPGGFVGSEVDLAVFFFDTALPGTSPSVGSSVLGEVLSYNGFGRPATPAGNLPVDGQRRLFQTRADEFGQPFAGVSTDYVTGVFNEIQFSGLSLGGCGTSGSSGSGVYNQSGQLVALSVAQSGSPDYGASTYSLRVDLHEPWIFSVPGPGTAALLVLSSIFSMRRRRM